ncbi:ferredoxin--NADP reductase [Jiulongibacter sediminis]|uniref:Oxidoreductase n=1 Tax=Jiulongibacter sediminis TaxID=1605367 RepID=A0A0P7BUA7_9BACT|nr:ferredoxin--NADP reductase [Jiulongibacter sediminis]KPM48344.1 oxidoreductase [Jiulongibacter sediminis]TBX24881.1 oxidoreductase [Jiulongibacter sediminis]
MKTYFLQVKEVIQETEDAITIEFWHPLAEQIKYKAGQFITLIVPADNGKKVRRSYSMSSSPHTDTAVAVTVKRVPGGLVSNYLCDQVKKGDFIEVIEPMGNFYVEPNAENERHVVLIGAGSGITPLMSIAKSVLKMEPKSKVSLIYGNRTVESIIFWKKLMDMELADRKRFNVVHVLSQATDSWAGYRGRINQANIVVMLKELDIHFRSEKEEFYLCGPVGMMDEALGIFDVFDVPKSQIFKENFNAPMLDEELELPENESLQSREVTVKYMGDDYTFKVEPHQSILDAALELDIDLPYSCQAGMCTACLGKCVEGKIKMDEDDGLTQAEQEEGWVLTCVSHPLTDGVVLEIE